MRKEAIKAALIWGILIVFMLFTRPANMPVYILFIPFLLLGFGVFTIWQLLVVIYTHHGNKREGTLSRRERAAGIAISILAVIIVGLQSIGEMTPRDVITVSLLALGAYFYFVRNLIQD